MADARQVSWKAGFDARMLAGERRFAFRAGMLAVIAGLLGTLPFLLVDGLDIVMTQALFEDGEFSLRRDDLWSLLRRLNMIGYTIFYIVAVVGLFASMAQRGAWLTLLPVQWLYLVMTSLIGPLLVTNVILKDNVGRPRPREISEFGGTLDFKNVFEGGGGCTDNCSFVSGEVSSMVMIVASLMFVLPRWRVPLAAALIPAWFYSAYMRVGQGGHFPSDTFLAGILMIAIAAILYRVIVLTDRRPAASQ